MANKNETKIIAEPGRQELFIIREFNAPRELVFKACTDPEIILQWLGPRNLAMRYDSYVPGTGGGYRYIHSDASGNEYAFRGVCHEVAAPERLIQTFEFEGMPEKGHVSLETAKFEALPDGRTRVTTQSVFQSVADRDGLMQSGMEVGCKQSYERLDEYLGKIHKDS